LSGCHRQENAIDAAEILRQTETRIQDLQKVEDLQRKEKELLKRLGLEGDERPLKRQRQSSSSDSDGHSHSQAIRVKNLMQLKEGMSHRKRPEWLRDLQCAFQGDPKRFTTESNRILFALDHMEEQPRNRWYGHCETGQ
jgi:hypothetical protein